MKGRRLELDYIVPRRRRRWPGLVLLGISLVVLGDLLLRYHETATALERLRSVRAPAPARPLPAKSQEVEERIARAALRQLALPWARLVRALEGAATPDVALLQLHPEAQQQVLRITAEARDARAMFRYLRGLAQAKGLSDIHLVSHQMVQDDPQHPVRFSAQASFRGMP